MVLVTDSDKHINQEILTEGELCTGDLFIKVACFVKKGK
jgi:hypothetical protein